MEIFDILHSKCWFYLPPPSPQTKNSKCAPSPSLELLPHHTVETNTKIMWFFFCKGTLRGQKMGIILNSESRPSSSDSWGTPVQQKADYKIKMLHAPFIN